MTIYGLYHRYMTEFWHFQKCQPLEHQVKLEIFHVLCDSNILAKLFKEFLLVITQRILIEAIFFPLCSLPLIFSILHARHFLLYFVIW